MYFNVWHLFYVCSFCSNICTVCPTHTVFQHLPAFWMKFRTFANAVIFIIMNQVLGLYMYTVLSKLSISTIGQWYCLFCSICKNYIHSVALGQPMDLFIVIDACNFTLFSQCLLYMIVLSLLWVMHSNPILTSMAFVIASSQTFSLVNTFNKYRTIFPNKYSLSCIYGHLSYILRRLCCM